MEGMFGYDLSLLIEEFVVLLFEEKFLIHCDICRIKISVIDDNDCLVCSSELDVVVIGELQLFTDVLAPGRVQGHH